jgi:hypothetical protein
MERRVTVAARKAAEEMLPIIVVQTMTAQHGSGSFGQHLFARTAIRIPPENRLRPYFLAAGAGATIGAVAPSFTSSSAVS